MAVIYIPLIWYFGGFFPWIALLAIGLQYLETVVFIALSVLFSTFASPIASAIYTIIVFIIGHSLGILPDLAKRAGSVLKELYLALYYVFPNLDKFNIRLEASHNLSVPSYLIAFTVLYGFIFIALFIMLAALSLRQQDI
jgi:hypothetical protein